MSNRIRPPAAQLIRSQHLPAPEPERVLVLFHPVPQAVAHAGEAAVVDGVDDVVLLPGIGRQVVELVTGSRVEDVFGIRSADHTLPEGKLMAVVLGDEEILAEALGLPLQEREQGFSVQVGGRRTSGDLQEGGRQIQQRDKGRRDARPQGVV